MQTLFLTGNPEAGARPMQEADRRCEAGPTRSDVSLAPDNADAGPYTSPDPLSARLLATHEHVAVVKVHGEIDLGTAPTLREVLRPALEHQTGPVVVDLSNVPFMDSTGVHVLVDTLRRLEAQNRPLALVCHEEGQVHRLLALVGLLDAVAVYGSRESALIGGDDVLRSEPGPDRGASDAGHASDDPRVDLVPVIH
jgi:anti-anti-sigma factor